MQRGKGISIIGFISNLLFIVGKERQISIHPSIWDIFPAQIRKLWSCLHSCSNRMWMSKGPASTCAQTSPQRREGGNTIALAIYVDDEHWRDEPLSIYDSRTIFWKIRSLYLQPAITNALRYDRIIWLIQGQTSEIYVSTKSILNINQEDVSDFRTVDTYSTCPLCYTTGG